MTPVDLPAFALGCAPLGNLHRERTDEEVRTLLEAAWEAGVRHFDTAPHYGLGLSERRLGAFLRSLPREEFVLSTKVGRLLRPDPGWDGESLDEEGFAVPASTRRAWDVTAAGVRASLEGSLERLGLDRVDVLYLHDPERSGIPGAVEQGMTALAGVRDEGLARWVGVGSMTAGTLREAVETGAADVVMAANCYTLLDQSVAPAVLAACDVHGTRIVSAAVFNSGLLAARPREGAMYDYQQVSAGVLARARAIDDVCAAHGVELPAAALHHSLRDPRVAAVCVGASDPAQLRQNLARLAAAVPDALWAELDERGLVPALEDLSAPRPAP